MALGLGFTAEQIELLRTAAAHLSRQQRSRYLEVLGAALAGRDSVGDGELHRLTHAVARELASQPPQERRSVRREQTATQLPG